MCSTCQSVADMRFQTRVIWAKLVPFRPPLTRRRFGALRGIIRIGPEFSEPLSAQELATWE